MTLFFLINDDKKEFTIEQRIQADNEFYTRLYNAQRNNIITRVVDIPEGIASSFPRPSKEMWEKLVTDTKLKGYERNDGLASQFYHAT